MGFVLVGYGCALDARKRHCRFKAALDMNRFFGRGRRECSFWSWAIPRPAIAYATIMIE